MDKSRRKQRMMVITRDVDDEGQCHIWRQSDVAKLYLNDLGGWTWDGPLNATCYVPVPEPSAENVYEIFGVEIARGQMKTVVIEEGLTIYDKVDVGREIRPGGVCDRCLRQVTYLRHMQFCDIEAIPEGNPIWVCRKCYLWIINHHPEI